ncbi:MAG: hypothetical protein ACI8PZ_006761 [Myxococcota bacterium]|jgi:hypothetical protein
MVWWMLAVAHAGYGDAVDGHPSPDDRLLHLYTNAARVDPEAHESAYNAGGCSFYDHFSEDEQTAKAPYLYHLGLNEVARQHSVDMNDRGYFAHDTLDGPTWDARIRPFYESGAISENIAVGYPTVFDAVFKGWMCSESGHRGAIMSSGLVDLGVGISGTYYTQDFGGGSGQAVPHIAMAAHQVNGEQLLIYADFYDAEGDEPSIIEVVLGPARHRLTLEWGDTSRGVYSAVLPMPPGCSPYAIEAIVGVETARFPEDGWYGVGDCAWEDPVAMWVSDADAAEGSGTAGTGGGSTGGGTGGAGTGGTSTGGDSTFDADTGDAGGGGGGGEKGGGCSTAPTALTGWLVLSVLGLTTRRRR